MREKAFTQDNKIQFEEITILFDLHTQIITPLYLDPHAQSTAEPASKAYLMRRVYPHRNIPPKVAAILGGHRLKDEIFNYLQQLNYVASIEECDNNRIFLIEFKQNQQDVCDFITFVVSETVIVFAIAKILAYGKGYTIPTLVSIDSDDSLPPNKPKNIEPNPQPQKITPLSPPQQPQKESEVAQLTAETAIQGGKKVE